MHEFKSGDALAVLASLTAESVDEIITSPPYWGLRNYLPSDSPAKALEIGSEPVLDCGGHCGVCYVCHLRAVFAAARRVLRSTGTLWLNLGDSYAGSWGNLGGQNRSPQSLDRPAYANQTGWTPPTARPPAGLKPKDLCLAPYRVAMALQRDGWYLRAEIIWFKRNSMPESVTDRPTRAHEAFFLFSKQESYFYDAEAIREALAHKTQSRLDELGHTYQGKGRPDLPRQYANGSMAAWSLNPAGRNARDVWVSGEWVACPKCHGVGLDVTTAPDDAEAALAWAASAPACETCAGLGEVYLEYERDYDVFRLSTKPYRGAHFAVMPPDMVERAIRAGTSEKGVCSSCGAPWRRVLETTREPRKGGGASPKHAGLHGSEESSILVSNTLSIKRTVGWEPSCVCADNTPRPAVILDPFGGSGTVAAVAARLRRDSIMIDLDERNRALWTERIQVQPELL